MPSLFLFWWFLFLSYVSVNANYAFKCSDDVYNWTISVHDQAELDHFMEQASTDKNTSRCIQLSLIGCFHYRLDIVKMMQIKLGTAGGLIIVGTNRPVKIDCFASISDIELLKRLLKPISDTSLVIFDGLMFVKCPVPILIEEVSSIVVRNCDFM